MARTTKPAAVVLSKTVQYRVPVDRYDELKAEAIQAGFQTVSDYCRSRDFNMKPRRKKATPERLALIAGLGKLGNIRADINQLLKDHWAYKYISPERIENVFSAIERIADAITDDLTNDNRGT